MNVVDADDIFTWKEIKERVEISDNITDKIKCAEGQ